MNAIANYTRVFVFCTSTFHYNNIQRKKGCSPAVVSVFVRFVL